MDNRRLWRARITRIAVIGCALITSGLAVPVASANDGTVDAPKAAAKDRWSAVDNSGKVASPSAFADLRAKAQKSGAVRVIVGLRTRHTAEGALSSAQATAQHKAIATKAGELKAALSGSKYRVVRTFQSVPYVALELDAAALDRLRASGQAASLQEDALDRLDLAQSSPLVEATESWAVGRTGTGQNVAVLDTGIEKGHSFLQRAAGGT
jgi:subtilisin family serine protease